MPRTERTKQPSEPEVYKCYLLLILISILVYNRNSSCGYFVSVLPAGGLLH